MQCILVLCCALRDHLPTMPESYPIIGDDRKVPPSCRGRCRPKRRLGLAPHSKRVTNLDLDAFNHLLIQVSSRNSILHCIVS